MKKEKRLSRIAMTIVVLLIAILSITITNVSAQSIDDGWYTARVKYTNYATGTNATYTLNVEVKYEKIKTIDFGNGGSVHSGYNNSGYQWSGGYITINKDYYGAVESATARVTIYDNGNTMYFVITIE